jgi:uncharacterized membrane protein YcjF (UPF0283 family)
MIRAALAAHQSNTSPNELNTTLTPHSIIHGDALLRLFQQNLGHPPDAAARLVIEDGYRS